MFDRGRNDDDNNIDMSISQRQQPAASQQKRHTDLFENSNIQTMCAEKLIGRHGADADTQHNNSMKTEK